MNQYQCVTQRQYLWRTSCSLFRLLQRPKNTLLGQRPGEAAVRTVVDSIQASLGVARIDPASSVGSAAAAVNRHTISVAFARI